MLIKYAKEHYKRSKGTPLVYVSEYIGEPYTGFGKGKILR